jgi:hypothetical protein
LHHRWDYSPDYAEELDEGKPASPHLAAAEGLGLEQAAAWRLFAVSSVLRDRHFPDAMSAFVA